MTLGAAIAAALPLLRAQAETRQLATCTITRDAAPPVYDAATLTYSAPTQTTVYTGPCRIRTRAAVLRDQRVEAADRQTSIWPYLVALPADVTGVQLLDKVTLTACPGDTDLEGRVLRVRIVAHGPDVTERRLDCEDHADG